MEKMITGSIVALVTPMHEDGRVDFGSMERILDWHVEQGTSAISVVGTTGESPTLSVPEHCEVIRHSIKYLDGRLPLIAGTGANSTHEALMFTKVAAEAGADACLLVVPYYNKPPQRGMYEHFKAIAEEVAIPQILYNVPSRTGCDLHNDTVMRLAELENIVGIKDATGDVDRARDLIARCGDKIAIYSGDDGTAMELMLAGGHGNVSVTANIAPARMAALCRAAVAGEREAAERENGLLAELNRALFLEANPIPVKWAMGQRGLLESDTLRLPLVRLDEQYHAAVVAAMEAAGV